MWMNSTNRVEQSDAVSPLSHDVTGAFSRNGKPVKKINRDPQWLDTLLVILYIFFLLAIDFILFAGSGDIQIVAENYRPMPEVGVVLAGILGVAALLILPFHKKRIIKYIIAALISVLFIYIIFSQFFLYQKGLSIGGGAISASVILALLLGGIGFSIFWQKRVFFKILYVIAFAVMFANVYSAYSGKAENKDYEETYNIQQASDEPNERFIFLMMPNLESYAYLSTINTEYARTVQDIMQGFYRKNKFTVFSKAYVPENMYFSNIIRSFNPTSNELSLQQRLNTKLLDRYWSFHNLKNDYIYLKNNELYDIFKNNGYQISAYKSRDFDICHQNHQYNVNRCVEKINKPINLYNSELPVLSRAGIMAAEWLTSMKLFKDASFIYNILGYFMNIEDIPMVGTDFNNLYILNADKVFDILFNDIKKDTGKQAYFVFVDLPSNMYVYDEYCRIKPQNKWVTMVNLPWIRKDYKDERKHAYLQQTLCLYGKMEEFMENLHNEGMLENTQIIIQGSSGVNDFTDKQQDVSVEQIINNRTVNMAIYDGAADGYKIDDHFCTTNQIVTQYLYPDKKCENDLADYHQKMIDTVNQQLNMLNKNITRDTTTTFENWYAQWQENNQNTENAAEITDFEQIEIEENSDRSATDEDYGIHDLPNEQPAPAEDSDIGDESAVDDLFEED